MSLTVAARFYVTFGWTRGADGLAIFVVLLMLIGTTGALIVGGTSDVTDFFTGDDCFSSSFLSGVSCFGDF